MDYRPGVDFAGGIPNNEQFRIAERAEPGADNLTFRDADGVDGGNDVSLPSTVTAGAGRIGNLRQLYIFDGAGSVRADNVVANTGESDGSERSNERIGGDAGHRASGIHGHGCSERSRIGELLVSVYFLNYCSNSDNAYHKFTDAALGSIFNVSQGQIWFYLKSRCSYAQRQASAAAARYAFDVRDGNGSRLFEFNHAGDLRIPRIQLRAGGVGFYSAAPAGTADDLFGKGVVLQVTISWGASGSNVYLNNTLVKSVAYSAPTLNWSAASNFDLGAYEYLTFGGYKTSDDIIDEFTVRQSTGH